MRRTTRLLLAGTACLWLLPAAAKGGKAAGPVLADGFPPVTDAERALAEVPYAKGAPAVVLQDVLQHRWQRIPGVEQSYTRMDHHRRIKILTPAGVEGYADWAYASVGDEEVQKVLARTILPDGREVEAKVFRQSEEAKSNDVRVAFAQVVPGAILDVRTTSSVPYGLVSLQIPMQERIPVLHARFVLLPPPGVDYLSVVAMNIPRERLQVAPVRGAFGTGTAYALNDVPPFGLEPFLPPAGDALMSLSLIPKELSGGRAQGWTSSWGAWRKEQKQAWDAWTRGQSSEARALARQVAEGKATPGEKAEAIRAAVHGRVRTTYLGRDKFFYEPEHRAPDVVLSAGTGTSADVAALHVTMLREVGVEADLVATRRRSSGALPVQPPMPLLLDDMLVRVRTERGAVYFNPSADLPVGVLPWENRDVVAMPIDEATAEPVRLPDFRPSDNRVARTVKADLSADGTLRAETTEVYFGLAAEAMRARLRDRDDAERKQEVERDLRDSIPGAALLSWSSEDGALVAGIPNLTLKRTWEASGHGSAAGKRVFAKLATMDRVDPADWSGEVRTSAIDMGGVFDRSEVLQVTLPEGVEEVTLPEPVDYQLGDGDTPQAQFTLTYQKAGRTVVVKRQHRMTAYRFGPEAWPVLRAWHQKVAAAEEQPIALVLP